MRFFPERPHSTGICTLMGAGEKELHATGSILLYDSDIVIRGDRPPYSP